MTYRRCAFSVWFLVLSLAAIFIGEVRAESSGSTPDRQLRQRIERSLDRWCRWLAGYLQPVADTEYYTMTPRANTGRNKYRDVAGNQFAAAAAGYWLAHASPAEDLAKPLRGLIRLSLDSHIAIGKLDRPEGPRWGASHSYADNWHADLFAGTSGMLMLDALAPPDREKLLTILAWEADKQVEYGIAKEHGSMPGHWPQGSVGESNAWSCALIQTARRALPDSPNQSAWREAAILYSLNAVGVPGDVTSGEVVAGKPLSERVKGANFEPGGIQEHHGFYHPGYMGWPLAYQAFAAVIDEGLPEPQRNPDVYLRNWRLVFDRLKQGSFANGRFIYCAGDDWNAYGYGNAHILPIGIFAAARFRDPDASRMAHEWLGLMEREQALGDGSLQGVRLVRLKNNYSNDFAWYEAISGASLAHALWVMDHMDTSAMPAPSSEEQYNARNVGTYYEPNARLVWHRTANHWASFSWRSAFGQWQAMVQPIGLPDLLKQNHNGMGMLEAAGATAKAALRSYQIGTFDGGGFWSLGTIDRLAAGDGKTFPLVRQYQALVALPEGPSIFVDYCQAAQPIEVRRNGGLGLRLAADIFNDNRVRLTTARGDHVFHQHPDKDTWQPLHAKSVTIEDAMKLSVVAGDGSFQILQKRKRPTEGDEMIYPADRFAVEESLVSHELYFGPPVDAPPRKFGAGEWIRELVAVIECDPGTSPQKCTATVTGSHPCLGIHLPETNRTVAINFSDAEQTAESKAGPVRVGPASVRVAP
ncbi:MAG: hypothetical protein HUU20_20300 [Pirellulales bacterium]|nr:hypothetical protein [Pirellulales bacterium]